MGVEEKFSVFSEFWPWTAAKFSEWERKVVAIVQLEML
jgi:hypothetical protein